MTKLLRRMFYWDAPAEGAVFASVLFWLGSWCLGSVFVLFDGITSCFALMFVIDYPLRDQPFLWQHLLLLAELGIMFYHLIVTGHFYHTLTHEKRPWKIGILALIVLAGTVAVACLTRSVFWCLFFLHVMLCWAVPLIFLPKQWKLLIPAGFGPALILLPGVVFPQLLIDLQVEGTVETRFLPLMRLLTETPWLSMPMILLGILCGFASYKAYAGAAGKPFRAMFGKGAAAVAGLFLLTYCLSLGMAYSAHCRTERHVAELEKFFGRPVNVQGMKELYYQGRRPDAAFWKKFSALMLEFRPKPDYAGASTVEFSSAELAAWRKTLESSSALRKLETMLEKEPPAYERDFRRGEYVGIRMPEYISLRYFVCCQAWRVRFAVADRNAAAALAALDRMVKVRDYLARDPEMTVPAHVLIFVENLRLDALERLLSAGLLSDSELSGQRQQLAEHRKQLSGIHTRTVSAEAVLALDLCDLVAYGRPAGRHPAPEHSPAQDLAIPAFYRFRWLFPAAWYVCTGIRDCFAVNYRVSDFKQIRYEKKIVWEDSSAHYYAGLLLVSGDITANKIHSLAARYLAMETLIGIELEKRRTGKYPDTLANPPIDPFGHPLLYKHGKVPFLPVFLNEANCVEQKKTPVMVDAVAVWSRGPDGVDDGGLIRKLPPGKFLDDPRAMLRTGK